MGYRKVAQRVRIRVLSMQGPFARSARHTSLPLADGLMSSKLTAAKNAETQKQNQFVVFVVCVCRGY
jgi:hypothetical protein